MTKEEIYGALGALAATIIMGLIGTGLEALGNKWKVPALVAIGKKLEAGPNDVPKLLGKRAPDPEILKAEVATARPPTSGL